MKSTKRFLYPPHPAPKATITHEVLEEREKEGRWIAQRKFNGVHCVIWIYQGEVFLWNRMGEVLGTYALTENMKKCLLYGLEINPEIEYVLDGELLHNKAKLKSTGKQAVENVIVLFDVLFAGKYLNQLTTLQRLDLLQKIAPPQSLEPGGRALKVTNFDESQIWLAEKFDNDFSYQFWEFFESSTNGDKYPEIEGLMLKLKDAKNTSLGSKPNDVFWMLRCRKNKV